MGENFPFDHPSDKRGIDRSRESVGEDGLGQADQGEQINADSAEFAKTAVKQNAKAAEAAAEAEEHETSDSRNMEFSRLKGLRRMAEELEAVDQGLSEEQEEELADLEAEFGPALDEGFDVTAANEAEAEEQARGADGRFEAAEAEEESDESESE